MNVFFISEQQNVVAVQYQGEIFYRVCKEIREGEEFLTYYGDTYFSEMGGDPNKFHHNVQDHVEEELVSYFFNTESEVFAESRISSLYQINLKITLRNAFVWFYKLFYPNFSEDIESCLI